MRLSRRLLIFGTAVAALAAALLVELALRRATLPDDVAILPRQSEALVLTGEISSLWRGFDHHFGDAARRPLDEGGYIAGYVDEMATALEDANIPVTRLEDLRSYGIEVEQGVGGAANPLRPPGTGFVYIADVQSFLEASGTKDWPLADADTLRAAGVALPLPAGLQIRVGDPESVLALSRQEPASMAGGLRGLRESRLNGAANLDYFKRHDGIYDGVRALLDRPAGVGPSIYLFWQSLSVPLLRQVAGTLDLQPREVRAEFQVDLDHKTLRVAADLMRPPPVAVNWAGYLSPRTAAVTVIEDQVAARYVQFLQRVGVVQDFMLESYGGVLGQLSRLEGLERVLLAMTGWRDGLPELVIGIWADPQDLDRFVGRLRQDQRSARDRSILETAAAEFTAAMGRPPDSVDDLRSHAFLDPEPDDMFHRYHPTAGGLAGGPAAGDFDNDSYVHQYGSASITFILPPVTSNDLHYTYRGSETDADTQRALQSDRYRLATWINGNTLWVASDLRELQELIDRVRNPAESLQDSAAFQAVRSGWTRRDKLEAFFAVDELTTLGLLSPESEVQEVVKTTVLDLGSHPAVGFSLRPEPATEQMRLLLRLVHRSGLTRP